jgi:hypothetical protein
MKKGFYLSFILCLLSAFTCFSQQNQAFTKDILPVSPEELLSSKKIRNPNATSVVIQGVVIEKRVAQYYGVGELESITEKKAKRINHLYLDSYEIVGGGKGMSKDCLDKIKNSFDLSSYNHLRKMNDRAIIPVSFDGCEFTISLFSWEEIDQLK